jgi:hypothetical protein
LTLEHAMPPDEKPPAPQSLEHPGAATDVTAQPEATDAAAERMARVIASIRADDVEARRAAEASAQKLLAERHGQLTASELRQLFKLLNTAHSKNGVVFNRFSPGFAGQIANSLIEQLDELNPWIERLWTVDPSDVAQTLDDFWLAGIKSAGRSFPSAILYLRDPKRYAVWTRALDKALFAAQPGSTAST